MQKYQLRSQRSGSIRVLAREGVKEQLGEIYGEAMNDPNVDDTTANANNQEIEKDIQEAEQTLKDIGDLVNDYKLDRSPTLAYAAPATKNSRSAVNFIQKIERDGVRDRIFGLVLGAFVGDSAGASLDVESYAPNEVQVVHALKLAGGGRSSVGAGQVGPSSEMAISIINALVETNKNTDAHSENVLDIDMVAQKYNQWLKEEPFDYDTAVNFSLKSATTAAQAKKVALKVNKSAMTNAALARIMPLAAWTSTLETSEEVKQAVVSDVELSHANPVVQELVFVYCDTIRFLLCNFNDEDRAQEAFSHAQELSEKAEFAGTKSQHSGFNCQELLD